MIFHNTFRNKKVFLTGHTGFKGSWLLYWLNDLGADIKGYSLAPETDESLYSKIDGDRLCQSIVGDIRDQAHLDKQVHDFQPDFVFHLAAQPLVRLSYELPEITFETNVMGTAYLLKSVQKLQKKCTTIVVTTDKVYDNKEWIYPYRESDSLGGLDPYSASKACAELVAHSYIHSFFPITRIDDHFKGVATARAGNVIGGGDWAKDRIVPDIINALSSANTIKLRNPNSVRPWQHVLEPLSGYLTLAHYLHENPGKFGGSWNFGPNASDNLTVEELVKKAISVWGSGEYINIQQANQPHEAGLLKLDISKAVHELNWQPRWSSEVAVERTLSWYKLYKLLDVRELLAKDIDNYIQNND